MSQSQAPRIRVVHVIQNLNYGGMEKLMADIVRTIDARRFDSHVLTLTAPGRFSREMVPHATMHVAPRMSRWSLIRPAALAGFLRELGPDVVHSHSGVWYKTARAARIAGIPRVVHTEHGRQDEGGLRLWVDRRAARLTDVIVAVSQPLRAHLSVRLSLPPARIVTVINAVDTTAFQPRPPSGALRRELGISPEQPIVGSVGRLEPVKGYETVIQAFAALPSGDAPPPVLVVAGEGSARSALEEQVQRLGVSGRVFLLGWRDDTAELLAHFRCFVLGSWSEGTSISLLEALASGIPPVVTAVGGNPDVLGAELAGQLVEPGETGAMADRIARLLDPATAREIGAAARRRATSTFSLEEMVRSYERIYSGQTLPTPSP